MNQNVSTNPTPPQVPPDTTAVNAIGPRGEVNISFTDLVKAVRSLYIWAGKENTWLNQYLTQVAQTVNTGISEFGAVLPSAATIKFTSSLHHISGSAAIDTIQVPPNFAGGPLWLVADGTWTLVTGGNIAHSASPAVGQCVCVVYDPVLKLHYPVL